METEPNGLSIYKLQGSHEKKLMKLSENEAMKHPFSIGSYPKDKEEYFRYNMNAAHLTFMILAGLDNGLHYYSQMASLKELEDYWDSLLMEGLKMIKDTQGEKFRPNIFSFHFSFRFTFGCLLFHPLAVGHSERIFIFIQDPQIFRSIFMYSIS